MHWNAEEDDWYALVIGGRSSEDLTLFIYLRSALGSDCQTLGGPHTFKNVSFDVLDSDRRRRARCRPLSCCTVSVFRVARAAVKQGIV